MKVGQLQSLQLDSNILEGQKEECLSKLVLFGEPSLRRVLTEYVAYFHSERNHQGKGNVLLFPDADDRGTRGNRVECRKRLGGLLRYYSSAA
jgi:putative transposase